MGCPTFFRKYLYQVPVDLSKTPSKSSAMVNSSAIYDVCINGRSGDQKKGQDMGSLRFDQCRRMIDNVSDYATLAIMGISNTPGFYWCCGDNVWDSLPPAFEGRCALCTLNDIIYVVEPTEFVSNHTGDSRKRRATTEATGYVHLRNGNMNDLATQYYALPNDHQLYSHSQLVFKSIFWNTELQYDNHYLIAITRHELFAMANATNLGFRGISNELSLLRRYAMDNRIALDAVTASQGGVCAIVGEGCCTYLPSESEGLGNLSIAINNLKEIQEGIVTTNRNAKIVGGFTNIKPLDNLMKLFEGQPVVAWIVSILAPIIGITLIVLIIMGCCFPIFRALILKSLHSVSSMTVINRPVRNITIYAPSESSLSSDGSSLVEC